MLKVFSRFILLTVILGVSACAVMQPKTDEELVLARAEQRQVALLKHDFKTAYQYMSPGYRQLNNLEQFTANYLGVYSWVSSNVKNISCEDDVCKVNVAIEVDAGLLMGTSRKPSTEKFLVPRVNQETWFKLDDKWWFSKSE